MVQLNFSELHPRVHTHAGRQVRHTLAARSPAAAVLPRDRRHRIQAANAAGTGDRDYAAAEKRWQEQVLFPCLSQQVSEASHCL